jgi:hypothetical protein
MEKTNSTAVATTKAPGVPIPLPNPTAIGTFPVMAVIGAEPASAMNSTLTMLTAPALSFLSETRSAVAAGAVPVERVPVGAVSAGAVAAVGTGLSMLVIRRILRRLVGHDGLLGRVHPPPCVAAATSADLMDYGLVDVHLGFAGVNTR